MASVGGAHKAASEFIEYLMPVTDDGLSSLVSPTFSNLPPKKKQWRKKQREREREREREGGREYRGKETKKKGGAKLC